MVNPTPAAAAIRVACAASSSRGSCYSSRCKPAHGYELMDALDEGVDGQAPDPGTLYRTLRALEEDGLVRSTWDTGGAGPACRVYELTEQGIEFLHAWAVSIRATRAQLDRFLAGYAEQFQIKTGA